VPSAGLNGANVTVCNQFEVVGAMVCCCRTVVSVVIDDQNLRVSLSA